MLGSQTNSIYLFKSIPLSPTTRTFYNTLPHQQPLYTHLLPTQQKGADFSQRLFKKIPSLIFRAHQWKQLCLTNSFTS